MPKRHTHSLESDWALKRIRTTIDTTLREQLSLPAKPLAESRPVPLELATLYLQTVALKSEIETTTTTLACPASPVTPEQ